LKLDLYYMMKHSMKSFQRTAIQIFTWHAGG